jgi:hypothetical protein
LHSKFELVALSHQTLNIVVLQTDLLQSGSIEQSALIPELQVLLRQHSVLLCQSVQLDPHFLALLALLLPAMLDLRLLYLELLAGAFKGDLLLDQLQLLAFDLGDLGDELF